MSKSKGTLVAIRLSDNEKEQLEKCSKEACMSLSQYIRYKALEEREDTQEKQPYYVEFLNNNLPLITRVLLDTHYHIMAMSRRKLSNEDYEEIKELTGIQFKKLKIEKPQENA